MSGADESVWRTMAVTIGVALFCSALVTTAVRVLRPVQAAYATVERNRAIVAAAGLADRDAADEAVVRAFLDLQADVVEVATGRVVAGLDGRSFDRPPGAGDSPVEQVPIYIYREDDHLVRVVLPMEGKGMWSTIRAYLALERDLNTVAALVIRDHGETPGIGDRIEDPLWLRGWRGKRIRDATGALAIEVSDDPTVPADSRVDTITGATVTSKALGRLVRTSLGPEGLATVIAELGRREQAGS